MFDKFFKTFVEFFSGPSLKTQFEDIVLDEAAKKETKKEEVKVEAVEATASPAAAVVETQITDAVTIAEKPAKPKRARTAKGKLKADDKATPEVNEAWEGGVAPAKKPRAARKKNSDPKP